MHEARAGKKGEVIEEAFGKKLTKVVDRKICSKCMVRYSQY